MKYAAKMIFVFCLSLVVGSYIKSNKDAALDSITDLCIRNNSPVVVTRNIGVIFSTVSVTCVLDTTKPTVKQDENENEKLNL
jgi:hypothetical protein